ncbi:hypothetical protein GCM10019059_40920 [Camelimonas fluminis]|uniref:Uncharacterized protein n=1 Tax=Camelimonas fluminis TaxID=1576911 RepID=A0ABV7UBZ9_9HYPH|nr:hypothetical protein [Camelimonas fluminis]GHE77746.1 hypothetical protein GCM10019059_40920 [Camelimonas fluminis]
MPIDFSKLLTSRETQADREAAAASYDAGLRAKDSRFRAERATRHAYIRIQEVSGRWTMDSSYTVTLHGLDAHGRRIRAEYDVPSAYGRDVAYAVSASFNNGDELSLRGYWKAYSNRQGKKFFTFKALHATGIDLDGLYNKTQKTVAA